MQRARLLLGVLVISFSAIFVRLAGVAPDTSSFFRTAYAMPFLLGLWWFQRSSDRRTWQERRLAFLAGMLLGLDLTFWHRSIEHIGAGLATVLGNTQVMFVGLAAWWLYGDRPSRSARWMVPVILGGVALISGLGRADAYGEAPLLGAVLGVSTGITYAGFILLLRQANHSPAPAVSALVDATAGACFLSLLVGVSFGTLDWVPHWPAHGWLFAVALGSQVVGWTLINGSLPKIPALEGSIMLLLQPVGTVLWGRLLFAEILSTTQWLGVALVVGGIGWLSARGALEQETEKEEA